MGGPEAEQLLGNSGAEHGYGSCYSAAFSKGSTHRFCTTRSRIPRAPTVAASGTSQECMRGGRKPKCRPLGTRATLSDSRSGRKPWRSSPMRLFLVSPVLPLRTWSCPQTVLSQRSAARLVEEFICFYPGVYPHTIGPRRN